MGAGRRRLERIAPGVYRLPVGRTAAASNVYLVRAEASWALVDAGWPGSAGRITAAAEVLVGAPSAPAAILLTHVHPDHSGAAGPLARSWGCPVHAHPADLPLAAGRYRPEHGIPLDRWVVMPLMRLLPRRARARLEEAGGITDVVRALVPDGAVPELPDWRWVPAPGHTRGSVAYLRPADGVLLTGDAVTTVDLNSMGGWLTARHRLAGPPRYTTWDWPAAVRSVRDLAALQPRVLGPGHGRPPLTGTATSLTRLARRLSSSSEEPARGLRHAFDIPRYGGSEPYRPPPPVYARLQWIGHLLTRLGATPSDVVTLEVPGRRTGSPRRTSLILLPHEDGHYLVALAGEAEWVRNVRAAGGRAVLARSGTRRAVALDELEVSRRAEVLHAYLWRDGRRPGNQHVAREADVYFGLRGEPDVQQLRAVAARYPVFRVVDATTPQPQGAHHEGEHHASAQP
jgi:deazaflavin-dependent oxidoreductase (nitroreductase family)